MCHVFIDKDADLKKAIEISVNAKTYRYGICGTMETLLTSEEVAAKVLPEIKAELDKLGVEIRGCEKTKKIIDVKSASDADWITEYLCPNPFCESCYRSSISNLTYKYVWLWPHRLNCF